MNTNLKAFISGLGSLLVFFPATNYADLAPKGTASDRIYAHWNKTGEQLKSAMEEYKEQYGKE